MRIALAGAVLALGTTVASAQTTGTISGSVTDAVSAAPLVYGGSIDTVVTLADGAGQTIGSQNTGPLGQYSFGNLAAGTYYVRVFTSTSGYVPELFDDIPCVGADCSATAGTPITLPAGSTVTANFMLSAGGGLSGTVRRASDATPVQNAVVNVYNANTSLVRSVSTDASGVYSVVGLPAGTYFAKVASGPAPGLVPQLYAGTACGPMTTTPDFGCRIASGTPITVNAGATTSGIDFSVASTSTITGRVQDVTGQPLEGIRLWLYAGEQRVGETATSSNGTYVLLGVRPGVYRIRTAALTNHVDEWYGDVCVGCSGTPAAVTVPTGPGGAVSGIDFSLASGAQITGTITCVPSPPLAMWTLFPVISAYSAAGELVRQSVPMGGCTTELPSQPYTLSGLSPGQYYLVARDTPVIPFGIRIPGGILVDQLYSGMPCVASDCDPRRGVPVGVTTGGTTAGVNFNMVTGASGFYSVSPVFGGEIRMYDARGIELVNVRRVSVTGMIQEIVGIPPGTYYARLGNRLHGRGVCMNCPPTAGKPIVVQPGALQFSLDFGDLNDAPITISGTVRNQAGDAPLSTITVELLSESGALVGSGITDVVGRYSVSTSGPGTYFLRTVNDRGFVDEIHPDVVCPQCDVRSGTPVVVGASNVTGIDFTLAAGGLVSGLASEPGGITLSGVPIALLTPAGALAGRTTTMSDGRYRVTLPAGGYRARAEGAPGHRAQVFDGQPCTSTSCDGTAGTPISVTTGADRTGVNFVLPTCGAMTMSPGMLASAVDGRTYRQVLSVTGGISPIALTITEGGLPEGVFLSASSGILAGTPTSRGRHAFTVTALDASGCSTARALTIDVHACASTLTPGSATVPAAGGDVTVTIGDACGGTPAVDVGGTFVTLQSSTSTQVVLSVPANPGSAARSASITIGRRVFTVNQGGLALQPPFGSLDGPADGAQVSGSVAVGGWALDDLEVRRVRIYRDPIGGEPGAQVLLGDAVFVPGARPDVRLAYPTFPNNDRAGWGFLILTNMLPNQGNGAFRIYAYAEDAEGLQTLLGARTLVGMNSTSTLPFGAIDTPAQGATIGGSAYLNFGWALTPQPKVIPTDGSTIAVYVDGRSIGPPIYNQFRADIAALFPGYANSLGAVGYKTIDTTALAEGIHTIAWVVADNQGAAAGIGSRYFTVVNSADAQAPLEAGVEQGRRTESLDAMPAAATAVVAQRASEDAASVIASGNGPRRVRLRALDRLELRLQDLDAAPTDGLAGRACPATWAGYLVDDKTLAGLPVGASIDPAGTFFWQPGPGFSGSFDLLFVRTDCEGEKKRLPVRVTIDK